MTPSPRTTIRVNVSGYPESADAAARHAVAAEAAGCDGWWATETRFDPFLASAIAVERTERLTVGTSIAVAFARNPMTVAVQANDLQMLSGGRFALGLGSQVKAHIERRYSMTWSQPGARMREFVHAVRAIWDAWATGDRLDFRGDFYTHTIMTPVFDPGPHPHGAPPILLAAVGPRMTEVAGEVADGFLCHALSSPRSLEEITLPALRRGREKAGLDGLDDFAIDARLMVITGETEEARAEAMAQAKRKIGFYASTATYRPVLEAHGWGDLQPVLADLAHRGEWARMVDAVDDEVVGAFAVTGTPEEAAAEVRRRFEGVATSVTLSPPDVATEAVWDGLLRTAAATGSASAMTG